MKRGWQRRERTLIEGLKFSLSVFQSEYWRKPPTIKGFGKVYYGACIKDVTRMIEAFESWPPHLQERFQQIPKSLWTKNVKAMESMVLRDMVNKALQVIAIEAIDTPSITEEMYDIQLAMDDIEKAVMTA
jgi:hypothetical protein